MTRGKSSAYGKDVNSIHGWWLSGRSPWWWRQQAKRWYLLPDYIRRNRRQPSSYSQPRESEISPTEFVKVNRVMCEIIFNVLLHKLRDATRYEKVNAASDMEKFGKPGSRHSLERLEKILSGTFGSAECRAWSRIEYRSSTLTLGSPPWILILTIRVIDIHPQLSPCATSSPGIMQLKLQIWITVRLSPDNFEM